MKNNLTELIFILDRSGSMAGLEKDTIGGFNAMIRKQRDGVGKTLVTTMLFDQEYQFIHDRLPLEEVPELTEETYTVRGCTALLDAVGTVVDYLGIIHKYAREEDRPDRTLIVITTDGMENASRRFSYERVQELIRRGQEAYGWEILFLGANMDAAKEAGRMGIRKEWTADYHADPRGTAVVYDAVGDTIREARNNRCAPVSAGWKRRIDEDYKKRR